MERPTANLLPDKRRLHLNHGPIDLIIDVVGEGRKAAYDRAVDRFSTILEELAPQLPQLRTPVSLKPDITGAIGLRMLEATKVFSPAFITPMAAVAGSVADEMLDEIISCGGVRKAYVNNGGDVAFFTTQGETMVAAMAGLPGGQISVSAGCPYRGIATSAWHGRSHSLGIADNVSVLALDAASADAAATLIANAVDLPDHPEISREPACDLYPDSDLGTRLVTTAVGPLSPDERDIALDKGVLEAEKMRANGLIAGAALVVGGSHRVVGFVDRLIQMNESELNYG